MDQIFQFRLGDPTHCESAVPEIHRACDTKHWSVRLTVAMAGRGIPHASSSPSPFMLMEWLAPPSWRIIARDYVANGAK
jgi:hypothetical protein